MWVCLTFCPGVLMSPSNLETPIFLFRGYFLISLIDHPHPPLSLMPFWKSCLESDLLKWSSNFLHFSLLFFIFLFLQPFCWYPPSPFLLSWAVKLFKSSFILNQCSLCTTCCSSFRIAISSLISLGILSIFTMFSFSVSCFLKLHFSVFVCHFSSDKVILG